MNDLGLYLHIPFCRSRCRYCDFCSFPHAGEETVGAYVAALRGEIAQWGRKMKNVPVSTVYFGGGTPTVLPIGLFRSLLEDVFENFNVGSDAEISAECNPATVDGDYLASLRRAGVNRLSVGAQSMDDGELRALGRIHRAADVEDTVAAARRAGFENLSLDLMFGIPRQTGESFRATLDKVIPLSPEHLSVYGLRIEEGTPFWRDRDTLPLPDEDTERAMYMDAVEFLAANGYGHYEISNFAREGYVSRHNLRYWKREDYLGLGLAAHSSLGDERFFNTRDREAYLAGRREAGREVISRGEILCERVMLGMRLGEGCDFDALEEEYGAEAANLRSALSRYRAGGFVRDTAHGLAFTSEGMLVSNFILSEVLDFDSARKIRLQKT